MPIAQERASHTPLRLWPGIVIVLVQWAARFGLPALSPDLVIYGVLAGIGGFVALLIWWLFFSRAAWADRIGAVVVMVVAMGVTWPFLDVSITTGAMGALFPMLALPGVCLAFVIWAVLSSRLPGSLRRPAMVAAILLPCVVWTAARTGGFTGSFDNDLAWRWTPTSEQRLLAQQDDLPLAAPPASTPEPSPAPDTNSPTAHAPTAISSTEERKGVTAEEAPAVAAAPAAAKAEWPGFRGRDRDGVIHGARIDTNWSASPPVQLWRRPVGPGWSSFSVRGDLFYTQEQRGDDEIVAAYRVSTGEPVWAHRDAARFWESNGGPGPRATPTIGGDLVYAFGATGILNALDAATGRVAWSRNAATDSKTVVPDWGFSSSPLLVDDMVIVAAAGTLVAYDRGTGAMRWTGTAGGTGYSSPHLLTIQGTPQIVLQAGGGVASVAPADGKRLWEHTVTTSSMAAPIIQPAVAGDDHILVVRGDASGVHRLAVSRGATGWAVENRWQSSGLKPNFNDLVVHRGHAFGFDGSILACIDLADGTRKWKGGRYGAGQLVLLADQDLLLVISEEGELALVSATSDAFKEVARIPAISGKTWNHPVLVGDVLLVRNGEEMAAFRIPLQPR